MKKILLALFAAVLLGATTADARPLKLQLIRPAIVVQPGESVEFSTVQNESPTPAVEGILLNRGNIDTRLLGGLLKRFQGSLGRRDTRVSVLRNFFAQDGNLDLLAWQIDNDPTVNLTPMPDTGKPLNDWLTWFIENIDEIIAAIQKLIGLFEGLNPGTGAVVPLHDGYAVVGVKTADGNHFALVRLHDSQRKTAA